MKNSWEKQQDGVIFKKIGIWNTLVLNVPFQKCIANLWEFFPDTNSMGYFISWCRAIHLQGSPTENKLKSITLANELLARCPLASNQYLQQACFELRTTYIEAKLCLLKRRQRKETLEVYHSEKNLQLITSPLWCHQG